LPNKIRTITVLVTGKLAQMGSKKPLAVSDTHVIQLKRTAVSFIAPHLRFTEDGYAIHVLGMNGEPVKQAEVQLKLRLSGYSK